MRKIDQEGFKLDTNKLYGIDVHDFINKINFSIFGGSEVDMYKYSTQMIKQKDTYILYFSIELNKWSFMSNSEYCKCLYFRRKTEVIFISELFKEVIGLKNIETDAIGVFKYPLPSEVLGNVIETNNNNLSNVYKALSKRGFSGSFFSSEPKHKENDMDRLNQKIDDLAKEVSELKKILVELAENKNNEKKTK